MDRPCSPTWQAFIRTQLHKPGNKKLNNGEITLRNGDTASGRESVTLGQTLCLELPAPGSNQTSLRTSKSCLKTPICWPSTNPAGSLPSPAAVSWKTPSCAWCKSESPMQTLSTGWAEPPAASSSSRRHRRRLLIYSQTGTHRRFSKSIWRWVKTLHSIADAYEIVTPIGLVPHPLIASGWATSPSGKPSKLPAKVDLTQDRHHVTFEVSLNSGLSSSNQNPSGIDRPSPGGRSSVRLNRPAS